MLPDSDEIGRLIEEAAAAEIMPRFRRLASGEISEKRPGAVVTIADLAVERWLAPRLAALLPGSLVVGEEAVAAAPGLLDALGGEAPVWIIDPIDGTANFASGDPRFVVMVALVRGGATLMAWIHDPVKGTMASAAAGEGAWRAGRRLAVAMPPTAAAARANRQLMRRLGGRSDLVGDGFMLRSVGQEYLLLAGGEAHFAFYNRLLPWDHAAGHLLHREAGGHSALLDGTPYSPRGPSQGLLLAPDGESWAALRRLLIERRPDAIARPGHG